MIQHGLVESACYSPLRQLSPTMKMTRAHSNDDTSEEFLEVHYSGPSDINPRVATGQKCAIEQDQQSSNIKVKTEIADDVREVVREQPRPENVLSVDNVTHMDTAAKSNISDNSSVPTKNPTDLHTQVVEVSNRGKVQSASEYLQSQELESGLPDAGTVAKMEEMIEEDDACFGWEDDKLLLEIDAELEPDQAGGSGKTEEIYAESDQGLSSDLFDPHGSAGSSELSKGNKEKRDTSESASQRANGAGPLSPERIGSKLKDRFSSLWYGQVENGMELQDMRPVSPTTLQLDDHGFPLSIFTKVTNLESTIVIP